MRLTPRPTKDAEFDRLMRALHIDKRRECIRSLLAGNDTCCFTTREYVKTMFESFDTEKHYEILTKLARKQLMEEEMIEPRPDVWTRKDEYEFTTQD